MSPTVLARYAKAACGAIVAGATTAGTAAADGHISLTEGCLIVVAFFGTLGGVAAVPNAQPAISPAVTDAGVWPPLVPDPEEVTEHPAVYLAPTDAEKELAAKHPRDDHGRFTKKGTTA